MVVLFGVLVWHFLLFQMGHRTAVKAVRHSRPVPGKKGQFSRPEMGQPIPTKIMAKTPESPNSCTAKQRFRPRKPPCVVVVAGHRPGAVTEFSSISAYPVHPAVVALSDGRFAGCGPQNPPLLLGPEIGPFRNRAIYGADASRDVPLWKEVPE